MEELTPRRIAFAAGCIVFALVSLFPPWIKTHQVSVARKAVGYGGASREEYTGPLAYASPVGPSPIYAPPAGKVEVAKKPGEISKTTSYTLDFMRLAVLWASVAAITAGACVLLSNEELT